MSGLKSDPEPGGATVPALEDGDYYFDQDGLMVFTRAYHLKRGSCCKSGCRHCPWEYRKRKASSQKGQP